MIHLEIMWTEIQSIEKQIRSLERSIKLYDNDIHICYHIYHIPSHLFVFLKAGINPLITHLFTQIELCTVWSTHFTPIGKKGFPKENKENMARFYQHFFSSLQPYRIDSDT